MLKIFSKKVILAASIVAVLSVFVIYQIYNINKIKSDREKSLDNFYRQQQEERAYLDRTYQRVRQANFKNQQNQNRLLEEIDKTIKFSQPECSKLQNRKAVIIQDQSCTYKLRAQGQTNMAVVFMWEGPDQRASGEIGKMKNGNDTDKSSLFYANNYLKKEGSRYGISDVNINFSFFGPFTAAQSLKSLYYRDNIAKFIDVFKATSEGNNVPEKDFDIVHYIYLDQFNPQGGGAMADSHRAFTLGNDIGTFIHETLHLFGATDKYANNDCITIGKADPFAKTLETVTMYDIMCSEYTDSAEVSTINRITAREIGWPN